MAIITRMFDATTVPNLPAGQDFAYANYVNGRWPFYNKVKALFPASPVLSIAVTAQADAECLDVEKGDATPDQVPAWVKRQLARGVWKPCIYTSVSQVAAVVDQLFKANISLSNVRFWSAHYTQYPHICGPQSCRWTGLLFPVDATQWTSGALGLSLDESRISLNFFGTLPQPQIEEDMPQPTTEVSACFVPGAGTARWVLTADGGVRAVDGAPFWGSHPGLKPGTDAAAYPFYRIEPAGTTAEDGYVIFGQADIFEKYSRATWEAGQGR